MNDNSETDCLSETERECLRELLGQQYLLHETDHHATGEISVPTTGIVPGVYTLIDVYKCLYQGEFGIGHNIDDPVRFKDRLAGEYYKEKPASNEPILENISLDESVFRVNIRPLRYFFKTSEKEGCELLYQACLDSADIEKGNTDHFLITLSEFRSLNNANRIIVGGIAYSFPAGLVKKFFLDIRNIMKSAGNLPVFGHSPIYRHFNAPSYRVIDKVVLEAGSLNHILDNQE